MMLCELLLNTLLAVQSDDRSLAFWEKMMKILSGEQLTLPPTSSYILIVSVKLK